MRRMEIWTLLAAVLLNFPACARGGEQKEAKMSGKTTRIPFVTIDPGQVYASREPDPGVLNMDEMVGSPPECYWIRSEQGWKSFGFKQTRPPSGQISPEEKAARELDFARHDVLFLTMGVQGTTGYTMSLDEIGKDAGEIRFRLKTTSPKPGEMVGEALTNPSVLVRTEKLPKDAKLKMILDGKDSNFDLRILE